MKGYGKAAIATVDMSELKPCPFCGVKVKIKPFWMNMTGLPSLQNIANNDPPSGYEIIHVADDHTISVVGKKEKEVIEKWNKRAEEQKPEPKKRNIDDSRIADEALRKAREYKSKLEHGGSITADQMFLVKLAERANNFMDLFQRGE